jgi:hypothetical protein
MRCPGEDGSSLGDPNVEAMPRWSAEEARAQAFLGAGTPRKRLRRVGDGTPSGAAFRTGRRLGALPPFREEASLWEEMRRSAPGALWSPEKAIDRAGGALAFQVTPRWRRR